MDTVQIQCGSCQRVMAIQVEHLGSQVHCPHCDAIVQAPAAAPKIGRGKTEAAPSPREPANEPESIFAGPAHSDDIFGNMSAQPRVQMPEERQAPAENVDFRKRRDPVAAKPAEEEAGETETTALGSPLRGMLKGGSLATLLLIFLVPYSVLATGGIAYLAYLLINQSRSVDPLERLPDPNPKDGGPRLQIAHDSALPPRLKTGLRQPLRIGAIEVTPLKVQLSKGELILHLRAKNMSKDQVFNPISHDFMKLGGKGGAASNRPYSYLDAGQVRLYGGTLEWLRGPKGKEQIALDGTIRPGEEETIRVVTPPKSQAEVQRAMQAQAPLVWRVQVRRGFVDVRGTQVSATAVIGVQFSAKDVEKEG